MGVELEGFGVHRVIEVLSVCGKRVFLWGSPLVIIIVIIIIAIAMTTKKNKQSML